MSQINKDNYFYKNLLDAVDNMDNDPEMEEYENFMVNGKELNSEAQLFREYDRILLNFTHLKGQEFDFVKHNSFRNLIEAISTSLKTGSYDYETIKKVMVHIDLELGVDVYFVASLSKMIENGLENVKDYYQFENFNYETLTSHYYKGYNKRLK